jgi:hypothetical protein
VADNIGVFSVPELESDGDASRIGIGIDVRDVWNPRAVGESYPDGS